MFKVYIVFESGHVIGIGEFQYKENAVAMANFHQTHAHAHGLRFEVCRNGETVYAVTAEGEILE